IGFVIVFLLTIVLLSSVVAAYTLVGHYIAAMQFSKANTALAAGKLSHADQISQKTISFSPTAYPHQFHWAIPPSRLNQIVNSSSLSQAEVQQAYQSTLSLGINAALTATKLDPADYQSWLTLGNLYAQAVPLGVTGAYASAKTAYDEAQKLNPISPQIP